jgi:hypothetical protein
MYFIEFHSTACYLIRNGRPGLRFRLRHGTETTTMAKAFIPTVFTANDLIEGDSVYLGPDGWVRDIAAADVAGNAEAAEVLAARAKAGEAANLVVGAYAVEVSLASGQPRPVLRREQIKASRATTMPVGPEAELHRAA